MPMKLAKWAEGAKKAGHKWPKKKTADAKKLAEKMKGKKGISNPFALSRWATARGAKTKK